MTEEIISCELSIFRNLTMVLKDLFDNPLISLIVSFLEHSKEIIRISALELVNEIIEDDNPILLRYLLDSIDIMSKLQKVYLYSSSKYVNFYSFNHTKITY